MKQRRLRLKQTCFKSFSGVAKFEKSVTDPAWVRKRDHSLVLSTDMKSCNLIDARMDATQPRRGADGPIPKLAMSFAVRDECHIKGGPTTKTAALMSKYVPANTYRVAISGTPIDTNHKSVKTYSDPMPRNKRWQEGFEARPYLDEAVDKPWMERERRYLYDCTSTRTDALQKQYVSVTRSKEEKPDEEKKVKRRIRHYTTQLCVGRRDNAVWLDDTPVSPLEPHWDAMVDIRLSAEYLEFLDKDYNYAIEQSVKNAKTAANWVAGGKVKRRPSVKASFVTAVRIPRMNLLAPFGEINQRYIKDREAPYKWTCEKFKNCGWLDYDPKNLRLKSETNPDKHNSSPIDMYYDDLVEDSPRLYVVKHFVCKEFKGEKILIFTNEVAEALLIVKVCFVSDARVPSLLITSLDADAHSPRRQRHVF